MKNRVNIIGGASGYTEIEVEDEFIPTKAINEIINNYTNQVRKGHIKTAYKIIMTYMTNLQRSFADNFNEFQVSSNLYQGCMDMTFISLTTEDLKKRGLKIVIVYLHDKGTFEAWISGRNRNILEEHKYLVNSDTFDDIKVFHDNNNLDAIMECTLMSQPNFHNPKVLTEIIQEGTVKFINAITKAL